MNHQVARNKVLRAVVPVVLCALVFFFALHAKTAVYSGGAPAHATPSTASKLWVSGQKMEARSVGYDSAPLFWLVCLGVFGLYLRREPFAHSALICFSPGNLRLRYLHRFLRPPPAQS